MKQLVQVLVVCWLCASALVLHFKHCRWTYHSRLGDVPKRIFAKTEPGPIPEWTGLVTGYDVGVSDAVVYGVVLPPGLLFAAAYLAMRWKRESRIERGCCTACGHRVRTDSGLVCPECGLAQAGVDPPAPRTSRA